MAVIGSFNTSEIVKGPLKIYLNAPLPSDNAYLTLTAGVPASGMLAGLTKSGAKVTIKSTQSGEEADELTAPFNQVINADELSIEWEGWQMEDMDRLAFLTPNGTRVTTSGVADGLQFGGILTIPSGAQPSVLAVGPLKSDPTKFLVVHLFKAINTNGLGWDWTKKNSSSVAVKMQGQSVTTRTAGNQIGNVFKTL